MILRVFVFIPERIPQIDLFLCKIYRIQSRRRYGNYFFETDSLYKIQHFYREFPFDHRAVRAQFLIVYQVSRMRLDNYMIPLTIIPYNIMTDLPTRLFLLRMRLCQKQNTITESFFPQFLQKPLSIFHKDVQHHPFLFTV